MSLIPRSVAEELDEILLAKYQRVIYTEVDGVPVVGVPIDALVGPAVDEAFEDMADWYPVD